MNALLYWTRMHAVACLALLVTISSSFASGIGGFPKNPTNPDHPRWFMYNAEPGTVIEDTLVVGNSSNKPWIVDIYPADSISSGGGGFALKQMAETMTEVGSWITMEESEVLLDPGERKEVNFTIKFPENLDVGQSTGGIMFERRSPEAKEDEGGGVKINLRTGIRVYQTTPGEIIEEISYNTLEVTENSQGEKTLSIELENTGNIATNAKIATTIIKNGTETIQDATYLLERGDVFSGNFTLGELPLVGKVEVKSEVFLIKKDGTEVSLGTKEASFYTNLPLLIGIVSGVILLLLIFIIWFFILRKRKKKTLQTPSVNQTPQNQAPQNGAPIPPQHDTTGWKHFTLKKEMSLTDVLHGIHHDTDFEHVAEVNNLKPPYIIPAGTSVLLPPPA